MTLHMRKDRTEEAAPAARLPRARGTLDLSTKSRADQSAIDGLRTSGCLRALFPRRQAGVEAIVINTSGGLTGGDRLDLAATAGQGSHLTLTTQAAERAYKASSDIARVQTRLEAGADASLHWLPQELILFEGARLRRRLRADLASDARLLLVEPVIFGRSAMGEHLHDVRFDDRIEVWRGGSPLYLDSVQLDGDLEARMRRPAIGGGAGAMASLVYVAPDAEAHLAALRPMLPETCGVSLMREDLLILRMLARDSLNLRRSLLPVLDRLSRDTLPTSWRL
ncbi:urease accessory protein UreD [Mameliella sp. AT18]|uniref:urease accessory protein UreD n=1 Tax=Mameliella sp. AT18 TaxID=3028385 RepID=UPI000AE537E0|nr:urease accessory protein UreD [Mameliella sp. AT18]MDD9731801.1 urease accessory protein UreD [Mameliella sp. AT18]